MGQQIPPNQAKVLFDNWIAPGGPGKAIGNAGFKDSYETWFSVQELQEYLNYVLENSSVDNPGIRIYFANYGNNPGSKQKLSTVFLAPTTGGINGEEEVNVQEVQNDYDLNTYNSGGTKYPPDPYDPPQ